MKTTLIAALLLSSLSASANYLKMSNCTGQSADGYDLNLSVYVEEDFYCVDKKEFKGLVVDEMSAMDALVTADSNGAVNVTVNAQLGRAELKVFELEFNEFSYPQVQKAKVRLLNDDLTTYEESELSCSNIEYHMDC